MLDTALALVLGNLFGRFPRLRILSIELGCAWVPFCMHVLDHSGGLLDRHIRAFGETVDERPVRDLPASLLGVAVPRGGHRRAHPTSIGADHVLFGSDWPHAEGTPQPADYATYLETRSRRRPADPARQRAALLEA